MLIPWVRRTPWGPEELPRPEALAMKRAVGFGTSIGFGELKKPGHPGTVLEETRVGVVPS